MTPEPDNVTRCDDATEVALSVEDIHLKFGGVAALDGVTFKVPSREICGLIGPNGAGKTSLFNCVSRLYVPQRGAIRFGTIDLLRVPRHQIARHGIARTFQNVGLFQSLDVLGNVLVGAHPRVRARFTTSILRLPSVTREERALREEAQELLQELGLSAVAHRRTDELPYGTLKRIELARALMARPRLLMLDEPAAGLTQSEVGELADLISWLRDRFELTVLLVEHHMGMVMSLCHRVVVLDFGRKLTEGTPDEVACNPAVIEAYLGEAPRTAAQSEEVEA